MKLIYNKSIRSFSETSLILITKDYKSGKFEKYHVDSIERAINKSKILNEKSLGGIIAWTIPTNKFNDEVFNIIKNHTDSDDIIKYGYEQLEFND